MKSDAAYEWHDNCEENSIDHQNWHSQDNMEIVLKFVLEYVFVANGITLTFGSSCGVEWLHLVETIFSILFEHSGVAILRILVWAEARERSFNAASLSIILDVEMLPGWISFFLILGVSQIIRIMLIEKHFVEEVAVNALEPIERLVKHDHGKLELVG